MASSYVLRIGRSPDMFHQTHAADEHKDPLSVAKSSRHPGLFNDRMVIHIVQSSGLAGLHVLQGVIPQRSLNSHAAL